MRKKTLIILAISFICFLSSTALAWWLHTNAIKAGYKLEDVLQTLHNEQSIASDQRVLAELITSSESEREELKSYVILGENGTIKFLSTIDELAKILNVEVSVDSLSEVKEGRKPYNALAVKYRFEGEESAVRKFIGALENVPYSSSVQSLQVNKSVNTETGLSKISGTISLLLSVIEI